MNKLCSWPGTHCLPTLRVIYWCCSQLQDAGKNKFSKCEHIDLDWGVGGEGEEEIYQIPLTPTNVDQHQHPPHPPAIKRSDTSGNLTDQKGQLGVCVAAYSPKFCVCLFLVFPLMF